MGAESAQTPSGRDRRDIDPGTEQELIVSWAPLPGSQQLFLTSPIFETLYTGTRGPGKTASLLADFAQHVGCGYGPAWRGIVFRQTYKQLADMVVKSHHMFRECFPGAKFNRGTFVWTFPDGEEFLLRQAIREDDYWDYHGHEYPWVGWEELTSWRDADIYLKMMSVCRSSHPGMPRKYRATTNPYGVGFRWVKSRFITPAPMGTVIPNDDGTERVAIHGRLAENPYLLKVDPAYVARMMNITDPNLRKAWVDGSWDINAGGAIDDVWDEKVHMLPVFPVPPGWPVARSFDWGSARPFSLGYHATCPGGEARMADGTTRSFPPGTVFRIGELYGSSGAPNVGLNLTNTELAARARAYEDSQPWGRRVKAGAADSAIYEGSNGFGRTIAKELEEGGITFVPAPKGPGSRIRRLSLLRSALAAGKAQYVEKPALFAFDTCREFRRQLPDLPRDPDDPEAVDTKAEDHLYDELTYFLSMNVAMTTAFNVSL